MPKRLLCGVLAVLTAVVLLPSPLHAETGTTTPAASAEPAGEPSADPTDAPASGQTPPPEYTPEPTLEPTLEPTPEPTLEPTAEPTLEPTPEPARFSGTGGADAPFVLATADELLLLAELVNAGDAGYASASYALAADIDLSGVAFTPIGTESAPFTGAFDGCGYVISGLAAGGGSAWFGLFSVTDGARLCRISLEEVRIDLGADWLGAGAIVGLMQGGILSESYVTGSVSGAFSGAVGGLVGVMAGGAAENCFNAATVTGVTAGGLAGSAHGAAVSCCYGVGRVTGDAFGMLFGAAEDVHVTACYSVDGTDALGTFVTRNADTAAYAGFDTASVWAQGGDGYPFPVLQMHPFPGGSAWRRNTVERGHGYIDDGGYTAPPSNRFRRSRGVYPATYRTANLPDVRYQNPYGSCWAHSIIAAAEISLIQQGLAARTVNLSELQFIWFHHSGTLNANGEYEDPLNNFGGDRNVFDATRSDTDRIWGGDNYLFASKTLSCWVGVTPEDSTVAYSQTNAEAIEANGLDYAYAFSRDAAHLENVRVIPMDAGTDTIKTAILTYGAVSIDYCDDADFYTENETLFYGKNLYSANHAVLIVGWDDTIEKERFYDMDSQSSPVHDGAWIVRNSWSSYWGDGGYFYMSYDTSYVTKGDCEGYVWEFGAAADYDSCYQYDGAAGYAYTPVYPDGTTDAYTANVFTAQNDERIGAVSFWLDYHTDLDYTVEVYTALSDVSDPLSGTLSATASGVTTYAGYYTVELPTSVSVADGSLFSVVVRYGGESDGAYYVALDASRDAGWIAFESHSLAGQSFVSEDGGVTWTDIGAGNGGNLRIKAFAQHAYSVPAESITVSGADARTTVSVRGTLQMTAAVFPAEATQPTVSWSVENGTGAARITVGGLLVGITAGTVTVRATAEDFSGITGELTVTVLPPQAETVTVTAAGGTATVAAGLTLAMQAAVAPSDAVQTVVWSVEPGTGTAEITAGGVLRGTSEGTVTVRATANDTHAVAGTLPVTVSAPEVRYFAVTGGSIAYNTLGMVTGCQSTVTAADIPARIGDIPVLGVAAGAFSGCAALASVTLTADVTGIGSGAFADCPSLQSIFFAGTDAQWSSVAGADALPQGVSVFTGHIHSYSDVVTPPSCTEPGYTTHVCTYGDSYVDAYVPATGHTRVADAAVAPTCTHTGLTAGEHCSVCGVVLTPQQTVAALGHTPVTDPAVAATYTATGLTEGAHCSVCGEVLLAQTVLPRLQNRVRMADVSPGQTVQVDGVDYTADATGSIVLPANCTARIATAYTFNAQNADPHLNYPTGMRVWLLTGNPDGSNTAVRAAALDNALQYAGSSIRITGTKGIRMITSVPTSLKNRLTGAGLYGYTLEEYGTLVAWVSEMGSGPLVMGKKYSNSAYAYRKGVRDPVYKRTATLTQYTNVLVGFGNEKCVPDLAMRPYMILKNANGEKVTLYGGVICRSIGYIAYQNRSAFRPRTASYNYIWSIIHSVYGRRYDADYRG